MNLPISSFFMLLYCWKTCVITRRLALGAPASEQLPRVWKLMLIDPKGLRSSPSHTSALRCSIQDIVEREDCP